MVQFWDIFYRALITAVIFTSFFLIMTHVDMFLEKKGVIGYNKIYMLAPLQFLMILIIYTGVIYIAALFKMRV